MAEVGDKLVSELNNLSSEEVDRLTQALRDEKFKKMLRDYAQEISDPANRAKYEEEIKLFEQERGNSIEFIHPAPCRVIETRAGGEQTCFINICGHEKIGKPALMCAVSKDGRRGQYWSLQYSLFPGRQNIDPKGNKYLIYDVIFHPDTLHMAAKDELFKDMVNNTAIDGIQKGFKVILDKTNVREIKAKYKGTPQPCAIRKPIPGYEAKETPEQPDPIPYPYPNVAKPSEIQPQTAKEPAEPNYTVKYRSVVDLQDFSPRPKEMVIVIDLPLLKSVGDTSLEVKGRILQLESKHPAYRLELPLAYPVDEDKGEAKFDKQRRQLTVTLPIQPPREAPLCPDPGQREEERREEGEQGGEERESGMQGEATFSAEEETTAADNRSEAPSKTEHQHILTSATPLNFTDEDREAKEASTHESTSEEMTKIIWTDVQDVNVSEGGPESSQMFVTDVANASNRGDLSVVSSKQKKKVAGEGGLPAERVLQTPELDKMPPSAAVREVDADGNETVISDPSTSAGFIFQNNLMYELD